MLKEKKREKAEVRPAASLYLLKKQNDTFTVFFLSKDIQGGRSAHLCCRRMSILKTCLTRQKFFIKFFFKKK